jgi:LPS-assembly lipoprotein
MMRVIALNVAAALTAAVAGCGFQLRGAPDLPEAMTTTYLQVPDRDSLLARKLARQLRIADVAIAERRDQALGVLEIHREDSGQRVLSVTAAGGPEEYEVFHLVDFSWRGDDGTSLKRETLTLTRDYTFDRNDVLGKQREYDLLRDALAEEMAAQMIRRLALAAR